MSNFDFNDQFQKLAMDIFFDGMTEARLLERFTYRRSKTFADVRKAFTTGILEGGGKFEHEIECAGARLSEALLPKEAKRDECF
jgi:hypothetical protein